ncbi:OmpA family protein [Tellurirhabdus rosea]|uniref:OmpA family protein n=1 Tax=Tellurirhabdus rosea TaxID=2674997 RepID=UPI00225A259D|nr:OmpA family protein [Tellurirhabdus rosea]
MKAIGKLATRAALLLLTTGLTDECRALNLAPAKADTLPVASVQQRTDEIKIDLPKASAGAVQYVFEAIDKKTLQPVRATFRIRTPGGQVLTGTSSLETSFQAMLTQAGEMQVEIQAEGFNPLTRLQPVELSSQTRRFIFRALLARNTSSLVIRLENRESGELMPTEKLKVVNKSTGEEVPVLRIGPGRVRLTIKTGQQYQVSPSIAGFVIGGNARMRVEDGQEITLGMIRRAAGAPAEDEDFNLTTTTSPSGEPELMVTPSTPVAQTAGRKEEALVKTAISEVAAAKPRPVAKSPVVRPAPVAVVPPPVKATPELSAKPTIAEPTNRAVLTSAKVFFDQSSYLLRPADAAQLNRIAGLLKESPERRVEITGYAATGGDPRLNQALSENRAKVVANYLFNQGVPFNRMEKQAKGQSGEGGEEARRVEVKVVE